MDENAGGSVCSNCHKPLSDPISVRLGMGPVCRVLLKTQEYEKGGSQMDFFKEGADYDYQFRENGKVLAITDLDRGNRSVTNDIENVLAKIAAQEKTTPTELLHGRLVIYRDSRGVWDGIEATVLNAGGKAEAFSCQFYAVNKESVEEAVQAAINRHAVLKRMNERGEEAEGFKYRFEKEGKVLAITEPRNISMARGNGQTEALGITIAGVIKAIATQEKIPLDQLIADKTIVYGKTWQSWDGVRCYLVNGEPVIDVAALGQKTPLEAAKRMEPEDRQAKGKNIDMELGEGR